MIYHLSKIRKGTSGIREGGTPRVLGEPTVSRHRLGYEVADIEAERNGRPPRKCEVCKAVISRFSPESEDLCWTCKYATPKQEKTPSCQKTRSLK